MATPDELTRDAPPRGFWPALRADLGALGRAPRELWIIFAVKLLESIAYFSVWSLLAVYLSDELGYSDREAGSLAGIWQTAISLVMFGSGFIVDVIGIRRALLAGIVSCLAGRVLLAATHSRPWAIAGLFAMTWGVASMLPTMTAGVRKYTRKESVAFGFSFFYVIMNVGAAIAGPTISYFRRAFAHPRPIALPGGVATLRLTSGQWVFAVGVAATALSLLLVLFAMRDERDAVAGISPAPARRESPLAVLRSVVAESAFWRFMLFVSLLVLVRLIFQHAHLTWPKYALREFGRDFPFASYWAINPVIIIVLTPVVTALTRHRSAYGCIVAGAVVSALSVFFMAAATTVTASLLFIVTLSIGEALWSPRLYEYGTTIAPPGREASYMGLAQLPMFLAKPVVGFMSGALLERYCPPAGARDSRAMWVVVGLTTLAGPVLIVLLRSVIERRRPTPPATAGAQAPEG
jgi:dipeptide/tripeptide permease